MAPPTDVSRKGAIWKTGVVAMLGFGGALSRSLLRNQLLPGFVLQNKTKMLQCLGRRRNVLINFLGSFCKKSSFSEDVRPGSQASPGKRFDFTHLTPSHGDAMKRHNDVIQLYSVVKDPAQFPFAILSYTSVLNRQGRTFAIMMKTLSIFC